MGALLLRPELTPEHQLTSLVESKTTYNTQVCELHIYETHQTTQAFPLHFQDITFTAMLQGKKNVQLQNQTTKFEYLPGT